MFGILLTFQCFGVRAACPDQIPDNQFIVSGSTIFQKLKNGSVRVDTLPPTIGHGTIEDLARQVKEYKAKTHTFTVLGVFDLPSYSWPYTNLKTIGDNNYVIEHKSYDVNYAFSAEPSLDANTIAETGKEYTIKLTVSISKKSFSSLPPEDRFIAVAEQSDLQLSRTGVTLAFVPGIRWPRYYDAGYINEFGPLNLIYTLIFGDIADLEINGCSFRSRSIVVEDGSGNKESVRVLIDWGIPLSAAKPPIEIRDKTSVSQFFRNLK